MTNRFGSPGSQVPQAPRYPRVPEPPGQDFLAVPETAILAGPKVKVPPDEEALRYERWQQFRASRRAASYPEFICFEWLEQVKNLEEGIDFVFQYPVLGGKTRFGGFVLDFFFPGRQLSWFVQGLEFHYVDSEDRARDRLAKALVSSRGVVAVEVFEDDIIQRTKLTLEKAWNGEQLSRTG